VQGYCEEIGELYGICPELLMSIAEHESGGNQYAENGSCKGLMQVSVRWHSGRMEKLGVTDIYDEYGNILVATDYIAEMRDDYEDVALVLMTYNGSSDAKERANSGNLTNYAESVLARSAELERLRNK
jgi:soluble lytic murein transglycosylase-like protein